jgi:RNA-binding protein
MDGKQRAELRKQANHMETIFQIGKGGINENLIKSVNEALEAREMIKLRVLENSGYSAKEASTEISAAVGAVSVQIIGTRFVIYRMNKDPYKRIYNAY